MIRAYWWRGGPESGNFGDQLTPILCQRLSGRRVVHAPPHLADVFAIGSILEPWFWPRESWRSFQGMIWGAGRMFGQTPMELPLADVRAVRGRLTLSTIACRHKAAVVLGDPGLLCALLARRTVKKYKLGVVPHWSERDHPLVQHLVSTSSEITLVNICDPAAAGDRWTLRVRAHPLVVTSLRLWRPMLWRFPTSGSGSTRPRKIAPESVS